jgi:hypothetical protein
VEDKQYHINGLLNDALGEPHDVLSILDSSSSAPRNQSDVESSIYGFKFAPSTLHGLVIQKLRTGSLYLSALLQFMKHESYLWVTNHVTSAPSTMTATQLIKYRSWVAHIVFAHFVKLWAFKKGEPMSVFSLLCLVCQIREVAVGLNPCGHVILCELCCSSVVKASQSWRNRCPLCRTAIDEVVQDSIDEEKYY